MLTKTFMQYVKEHMDEVVIIVDIDENDIGLKYRGYLYTSSGLFFESLWGDIKIAARPTLRSDDVEWPFNQYYQGKKLRFLSNEEIILALL